jgi:hypothetical protein
MNCFSKTNRNQADSSPDELKKVSKVAQTDTTEAESVRKNYDKKWQKMVGSSGSSKSKTTKEKDTGVGMVLILNPEFTF